MPQHHLDCLLISMLARHVDAADQRCDDALIAELAAVDAGDDVAVARARRERADALRSLLMSARTLSASTDRLAVRRREAHADIDDADLDLDRAA